MSSSIAGGADTTSNEPEYAALPPFDADMEFFLRLLDEFDYVDFASSGFGSSSGNGKVCGRRHTDNDDHLVQFVSQGLVVSVLVVSARAVQCTAVRKKLVRGPTERDRRQ